MSPRPDRAWENPCGPNKLLNRSSLTPPPSVRFGFIVMFCIPVSWPKSVFRRCWNIGSILPPTLMLELPGTAAGPGLVVIGAPLAVNPKTGTMRPPRLMVYMVSSGVLGSGVQPERGTPPGRAFHAPVCVLYAPTALPCRSKTTFPRRGFGSPVTLSPPPICPVAGS